MAVAIQYLVVRNGIEKMTFTNKKEADAYDRLLDLAEHLDEVLAEAPISLNETDRESLALYLAQNQALLSGPKKKATKKVNKEALADENNQVPKKETSSIDNVAAIA
ncbi:YebG family protein [Oceanisphaera pacifica]|uniref:YebG family protein n=1 Tax=Oceanisphaera pacifica TaxID=2818389 RepID=A0ABS3NFR7_9GAMM|nr:YebG family protein [Oceanisphaera pacifica]MBO1519412.1 YebG family protein [Oceanisphaera pacifica]